MTKLFSTIFSFKNRMFPKNISAEDVTSAVKAAIADDFSSLRSIVKKRYITKEQFLLLPKSTVYHLARFAHERNKPEALEWCIEVLASLSPTEFNTLSLHPMTFNEIALAATVGHPKAFNALTHVLDVLPLEELHSKTLLNIVRACIASSPGALNLLAENVNKLDADQLVLMDPKTVYHLAEAACQGYPEALCSLRNAIAQLTPKQKVLLGTDTLQKLKEASEQQSSVLEVYQLFSEGLEDTEDDDFFQLYDIAITNADNKDFNAINALVPELENISLLELRERKCIFKKLASYAFYSSEYKPFNALAKVSKSLSIDALLDFDENTLLNILAAANKGYDAVYVSTHRLIQHIPVNYYSSMDPATFVNMSLLQRKYELDTQGVDPSVAKPLQGCLDEWRLMNRAQFLSFKSQALRAFSHLTDPAPLQQLSRYVLPELTLQDFLSLEANTLLNLMIRVHKDSKCTVVLDALLNSLSSITKSQFCQLHEDTLMAVVQIYDVYPKLFETLKPMVKNLTMVEINKMVEGTVEILQSPNLGLIDSIDGLKPSRPEPVISRSFEPSISWDYEPSISRGYELKPEPVTSMANQSLFSSSSSRRYDLQSRYSVSSVNNSSSPDIYASNRLSRPGSYSTSSKSYRVKKPAVELEGPSLSLRF